MGDNPRPWYLGLHTFTLSPTFYHHFGVLIYEKTTFSFVAIATEGFFLYICFYAKKGGYRTKWGE